MEYIIYALYTYYMGGREKKFIVRLAIVGLAQTHPNKEKEYCLLDVTESGINMTT